MSCTAASCDSSLGIDPPDMATRNTPLAPIHRLASDAMSRESLSARVAALGAITSRTELFMVGDRAGSGLFGCAELPCLSLLLSLSL
jgi:hypothetical protein